MPTLLFLYLAIQSSVSCYWGAFDLTTVVGYEIRCLDGNVDIAYTPCMS